MTSEDEEERDLNEEHEEEAPRESGRGTRQRRGGFRGRDRKPPRPPQRPMLTPPRGPSGGGQDPNGRLGRPMRTLVIWVAIFVLMLLAVNLITRHSERTEVDYSWFLQQVDAGNIRSVTMTEEDVTGELREKKTITANGRAVSVQFFQVWLPTADKDLADRILKANPQVVIKSKPRGTNWLGTFLSWFPILLLLGFWIFFMRQMQVGGNRAFSFGKSKARLLTGDRPKVTFDDVAGAAEAKEELREIIDFLKDPRKFQRLGGRIPKGALLLGAPGTGKTLLARAVAGEAGVPFFSMSGSDFVEMFVGVGASRVRDLFEQGKRHAPCIIFIDEIDAVGRWRGAGLGGGHDEREQTLNQLLVEMDGFDSNEGVILVAATNRPDVLDPALLRPGRFDRQIVVDMPDLKGREGILKVHTRKIPMANNVTLKNLARATPGLSGADLANLVNEAALLAARKNHKVVTMSDLEEAKDKVMIGPERKSMILNEEDRRETAFHEGGHVVVGALLPGGDPIHKVTIIPRGRALGVTFQLPEDERYKYSKENCLNRIAFAMGGRAAEKLVFGEITTGAADDIVKATTLARKMVCEWGMSDEVGPLTYGEKEEQIFLGREISQRRDYSEETAVLIDKEIRKIVEGQQQRAEEILNENMSVLHAIAEALLEYESLDREDIEQLLRGEQLSMPRRRHRAHPARQREERKQPESHQPADKPAHGPRPAEGPAPA
jgi:cell division protease FtsH